MATSYLDAFVSSFSLIIVSEIGDKTFFIASLLAMQHPNNIVDVFLGATTALLIMTILSTVIGTVALQLLSPKVTTLLSSVGLVYFAVSLAITLYLNEPETESELEEVEKELRELNHASQANNGGDSKTPTPTSTDSKGNDAIPDEPYNVKDKLENRSLLVNDNDDDDDDDDDDSGEEIHSNTNSRKSPPTQPNKQSKHLSEDKSNPKASPKHSINWSLVWSDFDAFKTQLILYLTSNFTLLSPLFIQCCVLTFIAEWGDRSQIATILLASAKSPVMVTLGCIIGHMICTGIAISFGKILSTQLNDFHLQLTACVLFMLFGVGGLWNVFTGRIEELPQY